MESGSYVDNKPFIQTDSQRYSIASPKRISEAGLKSNQQLSIQVQEILNKECDDNEVDQYDYSLPYADRVIKRFNSPALINNLKYKKLKNLVHQFYSEHKDLVMKTYESILYKSLVRMLMEITTTRDQALQIRNLNKLYQWFQMKLRSINAIDGNKHQASQSMNKSNSMAMIGDYISSHQQVAEPSFNVENMDSILLGGRKMLDGSKSQANFMMSEECEGQKQIVTDKRNKPNFDFKGRTLHGDLVPAKDRIFDFKRRQLARQDSGISSQKRFNIQSNQHFSRPETAATSAIGYAPTTSQSQFRPGTQQSVLFQSSPSKPQLQSRGSTIVSPQQQKGSSYFFSPPPKTAGQPYESSQNFYQTQSMINSPIPFYQSRPQTQSTYAFQNLKSSEMPMQRQAKNEKIDDFASLNGVGNFYSIDPSNKVEDLKITKFWFSNINKDLKEKRSREENFITLNDWSTAKQRIAEEIASKHERFMIASDPSRLAVMKEKGTIVQVNKIYKSKEDFLESDESSLNTTFKSDKPEVEIVNDKKARNIKSSSMLLEEVEEDREYQDNTSKENRDEDWQEHENDDVSNEQQEKDQNTLTYSLAGKPKNLPRAAQIIDLTAQKQAEEKSFEEDPKFGSQICGIKHDYKKLDSDDDEESSQERKKKIKPFNYASLAPAEDKRRKILKIRQLKGNIIRAVSTSNQGDVLDNVFTSQSVPDTLTMSIYNRPKTSGNVQVSGLYPSKSSTDLFSTREKRQKQQKTMEPSLHTSQESIAIRPKTVGYSFSPKRKQFGRSQIFIQDRNAHINGSRQEQLDEVNKIAKFLARQSTGSIDEPASKKKMNSLPFSLTALQKAILLPEDIEQTGKAHPNPALLQIMKNPFISLGKAKKGKKGKK